jgi:steroid delta-isomerase-like uncharacterized protein
MSEELKTAVRDLVHPIWNEGNADALDEAYATDIVRHRPPYPDVVGLDAYKQLVADSRHAYPDIQLTVHDILVEGDMVVVRWSWQGTHQRQPASSPAPPTGKHVTTSGLTLVRFDGEKTVEEWVYQDNLGYLQQIGVVPDLFGGDD